MLAISSPASDDHLLLFAMSGLRRDEQRCYAYAFDRGAPYCRG